MRNDRMHLTNLRKLQFAGDASECSTDLDMSDVRETADCETIDGEYCFPRVSGSTERNG